MSKSTGQQLARLLDTPLLARVVPHLAPETLHQLVQYRGLDACGELVTLATPAQLTSLLDLDLWRHPAPGRDEQFDVERFGEWLEVLVETGESTAARTIAALDKNLVILGLCRYVRVFDPGTFEPHEQSDDEAIDRHDRMNSETSTDIVECEAGGYLVRARRHDAWDAIVALLVTLEIEHPHYFHEVMQGCRRLSNSTPELDGFYDLPLAREQHLSESMIEREQRRTQQGYATPADARAFLQLARQPQHQPTPIERHPIAAPYFRGMASDASDAGDAGDTGDTGEARDTGDASDDIPASVDAIVDLLAEAGMVPQQPRALLGAPGDDSQSARLPILKRLMTFLQHHDEATFLARSGELAFLANTLLAGCSVQSRPFTPQEASAAAASVCNLGLECWPSPPDDLFLGDHDLVMVFEAGWSVLHREVSVFVADRLEETLGAVGAAGIDDLAMLDMTAWISVRGLLDDCPIIPAALTAMLERSTAPVSPTDFEFISTRAQLGDIRVFMSTLPAVLAG